jgi:hypothetical protein
LPKEYGVVYTGSYIVRTLAGEKYLGNAKAIGGMSIIKIKPPKFSNASNNNASQLSELAVGSTVKKIIRETGMVNEKVHQTTEQQNTNRYIIQSHMENLYDLLAGLSLIEQQATKTKSEAILAETVMVKPDKLTRNNISSKEKVVGSAIKTISGQHEDKILDGSGIGMFIIDYRPTSRSPDTTPPHPGSPINDYMSTKLVGELLKIEKELEIGIGLREGQTSLISKPLDNTLDNIEDINVKSPSGRSYTPGKKRGAIRRSTDDSFIVSQHPGSSMHTPDQQNINDIDLHSSIPSNGRAHPRPPSVPQSDHYSRSRLSTPMHDILRKSLASRGLLATSPPDGVTIDQAEIQVTKSAIENILVMARDISFGIGKKLDSEGSQALFEIMNERILNSTKSIINSFKSIEKDNWMLNRDFMVQAIKRLRISTLGTSLINLAMETMATPVEVEESIDSDCISLGVVKGGEISPMIILFSLPNEGNMSFEYSIIVDQESCSMPENASFCPGENVFFTIDPCVGSLGPGESVNISGSFHAITSGVYRQKYIVKSFDEEVLQFTVEGHVGNPELIISTQNIDYGLVERGKSYTKAAILTNIGTYLDQWRVEIECHKSDNGTEYVKPTFRSEIESGETLAKQNYAIPITFFPPEEGVFKGSLNIIGSRETIVVALVGTGGGARLEFFFNDASDKIFGGLDFGTCIVGMQFEKIFVMKNIGTVDAIVKLTHPNSGLTFKFMRNDQGEVRIPPNKQLEAIVYFTPTSPEIVRDPITVDLGASGIKSISLKAKCGAHAWNCNGNLVFLNMPIGESQSRIITVQNTGTLEIPFEVIGFIICDRFVLNQMLFQSM